MGRSDCQAAHFSVRAPSLASLAQDEVRSDAGTRCWRIHGSAGHPRGSWCIARRILRRGRFRLRRQNRHWLRYKAAAGSAGATRQVGDPEIAVHEGQRAAAHSSPLGSTQNRGAGCVHRVDRTQQTAPSAVAGRSLRQITTGGCQGNVVITHPEKVLLPDDGITKGDLAAYYEMVGPSMLPHIVRRPITMERFPSGIGQKGFFQKDVSKGFPEWLQRVKIPKKDGIVHHSIVTDTRSLLWLVNQNSITPHVWTSRAPDVFDLDPSVDDAGMLRTAALALRDLLDELGLPSWVKTSGSKGFHITVPLDGKTDMGAVYRFANAVGTLCVNRDPANFTQEFHKVDRGRKILVDTGRNGWSATHAAPYAVRAKPGAPVSAACTWEELESGKIGPRTSTLKNMADRIQDVGDLWAGLRRRRRSLQRALLTLEALSRKFITSGRAVRG